MKPTRSSPRLLLLLPMVMTLFHCGGEAPTVEPPGPPDMMNPDDIGTQQALLSSWIDPGAIQVNPSLFPCVAGEGDACCAPTHSIPIKHCGDGFGCNWATGRCMACGQDGKACCDGPNVYGKPPISQIDCIGMDEFGQVCVIKEISNGCINSMCNEETHQCKACAPANGEACCPPDQLHPYSHCNEFGPRNACNTSTMRCEPCGDQGQLSCTGPYGPCRSDRNLTDINGRCVPCGELNQPSCEGECNNAHLVDRQGTCVACGELNQPSCRGSCNNAHLVDRQGTCVACGEFNQPSCHGSCNNARLVDQWGTCVSCGDLYQPVCADGTCAQTTLRPSNGACTPCGEAGQHTCNGTCRGNAVPDASDMCVACGHKNEPVCPNNVCLESRLAPRQGKCVSCGDAGQISCHGQCYGAQVVVSGAWCQSCGDNGELVCATGCNSDQLAPSNGRCYWCGESGQPVCTNGLCDRDTLVPHDGRCMPCGGVTNYCCKSNTCKSGLTCNSTNHCAPGSSGGSTCECTPSSTSTACGMSNGELCDLDGPLGCRPGLGCTKDQTGSGPYRCRPPEPWENWSGCTPKDCWSKSEVGLCHKKADDDDYPD